ncbi:hypothetical protein MAR_036224 [Mya arenaria]|uniref:Uncharacterized protein n=1 Tax=Mya arenaria TaxID=6604 RepID=A0ABY7EMD9_MYAAR|nr:hypothetical protein MAR_036224 [Mya arenaria]
MSYDNCRTVHPATTVQPYLIPPPSMSLTVQLVTIQLTLHMLQNTHVHHRHSTTSRMVLS